MQRVLTGSYGRNFLGNAPDWYKLVIIAFLVVNPILMFTAGAYWTGWVLVLEFIFTLAMALKCYPLQPGGLLAIEAVFLGLTSKVSVYHEIEQNLKVLLLLIFMVAGIYFMRALLLFIFTKIVINIRSKIALSLVFCAAGAFLSAFLDALTVTAVIIAIATGFYGIYHKVASGKRFADDHDYSDDDQVQFDDGNVILDQFRGFLRSLMMHGAVGTALGGVMTLVGEPQNLLIAEHASWDFIEFLFRMAPVTVPVFIAGLTTCALLEMTGKFGYGDKLPDPVRGILKDFDTYESAKRTKQQNAELIVQGAVAIWLIAALSLHLTEVGVIGLSVIILVTAFTGVIDEHKIGGAFAEALPFAALLVVFFAVVAVIDDQGLFQPIVAYVLTLEGINQIAAFFVANGVLSAISDNVFVATVYIGEIEQAWHNGVIDRDTFDLMAVAINTGTNIPSVATPNGQAAFLFLLTSALAPLIRLSYLRMVWMALPYTIVMSSTALFCVYFVLVPATAHMYDAGLINHHQKTDPAFPAEGDQH